MPKTDLEARFNQVIARERWLDSEDPVLLAVSGGADSVAMLSLFRGLNQQPDWSLPLIVAHVNHHLRGAASDGDAAFVQDLCRTWHVPCTIESADVAGRARAEKVSVEQAGREYRFELFERICLKAGMKVVALAHHADDNAETILHRIIRGAGLRGLAGIRPRRPLREGGDIDVIRPLLTFRRAEIEAYLAERGIAFRQDASNASLSHTRNRIRHELLPLLRERFNPQTEEALLRLAEQARGLNAYLAETGERMLDSLVVEHNDRQLILHCPPLLRKPRVIQTQLIRSAILRMGCPEGELTYGHLNAVADLAAGREGSKSLDLPAGMRVIRRYSRLVFERSPSGPPPRAAASEIRVASDGTTPLPGFGLEITVDQLPADEATIAAHIGLRSEGGPCHFEEWLDAEAVHPPLIARSRRPGDRFFPLGMPGMKKLSDFFIDEKVDADRRERVVVLCDQLGPVWVVPLRIDERVRLTRATRRILRLRTREWRMENGELRMESGE